MAKFLFFWIPRMVHQGIGLGMFFLSQSVLASPQGNQTLPQKILSVFPMHVKQDPDKPFPYVNPEAPQGGTITTGEVGSFDSLYSFFLRGKAASGLELVYATLFKESREEPGVSVPYGAESVTVTPHNVTFQLRSGITFQDGSPIRPEDVIFSFQFLTKNLPLYRHYYQAIKEAKKAGDRNIEFVLKPNAPKETALILSQLPILSEAFFTKNDVEKNPLTPPLASGPYAVAKIEVGKRVVFERVRPWWGDRLPCNQGFYNAATLCHEYFRDTSVLFEAFKKGEVDLYLENIAKNWDRNYDFPAFKQGKVIKKFFPRKGAVGSLAFVFNARKPLFDDARVRRALGMVLDFPWMNKHLFYNSYQRVTSLFENTAMQAKGKPSQEELALLKTLEDVPSEALTHPVETFTLGHGSQKEKARQALALLQQAGWSLKKGVLTHPEKGPFVFSFLVHFPEQIKAVQAWKRTLEAIGVTLNLKSVDGAHYQKLRQDGDFDVIQDFLCSSADFPGNELLNTLGSASAHEKGSHNLAGVQNKAVDALIQKILTAQTYGALRTSAHGLDRVMMALGYGVPLWYLNGIRLAYWNRLEHSPGEAGLEVSTWWQKQKTSAP
jgi:microcin C transport system substrate-binding protein